MEIKQVDIYDRAYRFALKVVKIHRFLVEEKREFILSRQLLRSGTSIAANIAEAMGAVSRAEFSNKMSISYKECRETKYWLDLLTDSEYLPREMHDDAYKDAEEISKILFTIIRKTRKRT